MSEYGADHNRRSRGRTILAASFAASALAITGAGVYAGLTATAGNTTAQTVTSGTLSLTMANNGVGFGQAVSNMAPADVVNRYVDLTNGGNLAAQNLTLSVADGTATPTKLTTDATNGLRVTVNRCTNATGVTGAVWKPATGACEGINSLGAAAPGTVTALATAVPLATLRTTASTLVTGAVGTAPVLLQMSLALPDQNETTVNGTAPAGTIQGLSAALTWTFSESQRTATTTTS